MIKVVIESPYNATTQEEIDKNIEYARLCMSDSLSRDEAPFASHLLYTQPNILRDKIKKERRLGMEAGFLWGECADKTIVYTDYGISDGMQQGIDRANLVGRAIEYRKLYE